MDDLFKSTKPESFDSFDGNDRDLFSAGGGSGGGRVPSSSTSGSGYQYSSDLFSGRNGKPSQGGASSGNLRYNREGGREYSGEKWNNSSGTYHGTSKSSYGQNERDNRYPPRYQQQGSHHYQRSSSHNNTDEDQGVNSRFGSGGAASDDDDYRRSSLPEWSLDDPSSMDVTRVGSFDASGAFHEALEDDASLGDNSNSTANGGEKKRESNKQQDSIGGKVNESPRSLTGERTKLTIGSSSSSTTNNTTNSSTNINNGDGDDSFGRKRKDSSDTSKPQASQQKQSVSSTLQIEATKVDYFDLTDPSLSPSSKAKSSEFARKEAQTKGMHKLYSMHMIR